MSIIEEGFDICKVIKDEFAENILYMAKLTEQEGSEHAASIYCTDGKLWIGEIKKGDGDSVFVSVSGAVGAIHTHPPDDDPLYLSEGDVEVFINCTDLEFMCVASSDTNLIQLKCMKQPTDSFKVLEEKVYDTAGLWEAVGEKDSLDEQESQKYYETMEMLLDVCETKIPRK